MLLFVMMMVVVAMMTALDPSRMIVKPFQNFRSSYQTTDEN